MEFWRLKSCPRCGGDMFLDTDMDKNWYEQCLQCSFRHELKSIYNSKEKQSESTREKVLVRRIRKK